MIGLKYMHLQCCFFIAQIYHIHCTWNEITKTFNLTFEDALYIRHKSGKHPRYSECFFRQNNRHIRTWTWCFFKWPLNGCLVDFTTRIYIFFLMCVLLTYASFPWGLHIFNRLKIDEKQNDLLCGWCFASIWDEFRALPGHDKFDF